ncbi:MAG TPA: hypothetical protein VGK50_05315 [Coriobacteriia bacterium]|jgi:hypothetical protein
MNLRRLANLSCLLLLVIAVVACSPERANRGVEIEREAGRVLKGQATKVKVEKGDPKRLMLKVQMPSPPTGPEVLAILDMMHRLRPDVDAYVAFESVSPLPDGTGDFRLYLWTPSETTQTLPSTGAMSPHTLRYFEGRARRPVLEETVGLRAVAESASATIAYVRAGSSGKQLLPPEFLRSTLGTP